MIPVRLTRLLGKAVILSLCLVSLSTVPVGAEEESSPDKASYLVRPGDVLNISVWKEEDLQREVLIRPDGGFSFPLAGEVAARGKSVEQIRAEIVGLIGRFIPDPEVTVALLQNSGNRIYVIGKVNRPGDFVMQGELDVMQALSMAGGTTTFAALNDIHILRRGASGQTAIPFRYAEVEKGQNLEQNIILRSGDVVVVP